MYGTTCFQCQGKRNVFTKRGTEASRYLTELRSRKASELKIGDVIQYKGLQKAVWVTITKIESYDNSNSHSYVNGVEIPQRTDLLSISTSFVRLSGIAPEDMIRVRQTEEQSKETLKLALEYQNTLTKAGTVRKS